MAREFSRERRTGDEFFRKGPTPLEFSVLDFWRWSSSDLLSNALRGRVAEFIVAQALGVAGGVRAEWDPYDLTATDGTTIEVKSSAYVQTWTQVSPSKPTFSIGPSRAWSATTNEYVGERRRQAQVYIFALLAHRDHETIDPLDVGQWEFFVLPTRVLDEKVPEQQTLSLSSLLKLQPLRCGYSGLAMVIERAVTSRETGVTGAHRPTTSEP